MTRTKIGKSKRAKAFFEDCCTFIPGVGEVVLTYSDIRMRYHMFTEDEWKLCGENGSGSRLTADVNGNIFDGDNRTGQRLGKQLRASAF